MQTESALTIMDKELRILARVHYALSGLTLILLAWAVLKVAVFTYQAMTAESNPHRPDSAWVNYLLWGIWGAFILILGSFDALFFLMAQSLRKRIRYEFCTFAALVEFVFIWPVGYFSFKALRKSEARQLFGLPPDYLGIMTRPNPSLLSPRMLILIVLAIAIVGLRIYLKGKSILH
ncbi:hypothetical protein HY256_10600 [Candidatus Sumerlaeota bacterium]|nr:hypothetical protein [Candidatus Sumerlaeota bacterium]